jgi:hypothetical protein
MTNAGANPRHPSPLETRTVENMRGAQLKLRRGRPKGAMSLKAVPMAILLVMSPVPLGAQSPPPAPEPRGVSLGTTTGTPTALPAWESQKPGSWGAGVDFTSKGDPARPLLAEMPYWRLSARVNRQIFGHVEVGAAAIATRGHEGPAYASQELGTGRDLSVPNRRAALGSFGTAWNTTFTVSVPVKTTGRVRSKAVGEIWNPFGRESSGGGTTRFGRAIRAGVVTTF